MATKQTRGRGQVQATIPEDAHDWLEQYAYDHRQSVSSVIREAVESFIATHDLKKAQRPPRQPRRIVRKKGT